MQVAETTIGPNPDAATLHLTTLFGRCIEEYPGGMMELRCIHPDRKSNSGSKLIKVNLFVAGEFAAAIAWAIEMNAQGFNIYVGVNPRKPGTPPFGAASSEDVEIAFFQFADLDREDSINILRNGPPIDYTFAITTGTIPTIRPHIYFELKTPSRNMKVWTDVQIGLKNYFKSDAVIDPPRIMRLAGMISYPDAKKAAERGYIIETVTIRTDYEDNREPVSPVLMYTTFAGIKDTSVDMMVTAKPGDSLALNTWGEGINPEQCISNIKSGQELHNNTRDLVAHMVGTGSPDWEITALCNALLIQVSDGGTIAQIDHLISSARKKYGISNAPKSTPSLTNEQVTQIIDATENVKEDREHLSTKAWLIKDLPPRDYLLSSILCTTSRWMIYGQTGLGKTLFTLNICAAMSVGCNVMGWVGQRKCKVMYLDGEMPAETFKDRIKQIVSLYGRDCDIYGSNRDDLGDGQMPPLNTPEGEAWVWKEIAIIEPDVIVFDSIMCLLNGNMKEEESWEPVKPMIRRITSKRIAQIWLHHSGHAAAQSYGTSTRTWEMDTVLRLERLEDGQNGFKFSFEKARLRTHENEDDFAPRTACLGESGWNVDHEIVKEKKGSYRQAITSQLLRSIDNLTIDLPETNHHGLDGNPVRATDLFSVIADMKRYDVFVLNEKGQLTGNDKKTMQRAKNDLKDAGKIATKDGFIWRLKNG
jgi:hypothetical protein